MWLYGIYRTIIGVLAAGSVPWTRRGGGSGHRVVRRVTVCVVLLGPALVGRHSGRREWVNILISSLYTF